MGDWHAHLEHAVFIRNIAKNGDLVQRKKFMRAIGGAGATFDGSFRGKMTSRAHAL